MPTIHREEGFAFRVYPGNHEPPHVHAISANGEARIAIGNQSEPPAILTVFRLDERQVVRAYRIVEQQQEAFLDAWRRIQDS